MEMRLTDTMQSFQARKGKNELQNKTELNLATVFASSGRGQFGNQDGNGNSKAMDWALLDCLQNRLGDNTVSKILNL